MIKDTTIITAPFIHTAELLKQNYLCISVTGKVYGDYTGKKNIERIRGLNTYRFYYNQNLSVSKKQLINIKRKLQNIVI